jgi:ribosomal protein S18 acetylase RimI-like enzyme
MNDQNPNLSFQQATKLGTICCRPITPEDEAFLCHLYCTTRGDLAVLGLDGAQLASLMALQFRAQHQQYLGRLEHIELDHTKLNLVLLDNQPIGQLYLNLSNKEIRILELAILPAYQNQGIGTILLQEIVVWARQMGQAVTLNVLRNNDAAFRLYQRLGFKVLQEDEVSYFMAWMSPEN